MRRSKLTIKTDQLLDRHEMVNAKDQFTDQYVEKIVGTVMAGSSTRTLRQGVYAIYSDQRIDYSITGRYKVSEKTGKDDWPLPPAVAPDVFKNATNPKYSQTAWDKHVSTFMRLQGEGTVGSIFPSVQVGKLEEGFVVPDPLREKDITAIRYTRSFLAQLSRAASTLGAPKLPDLIRAAACR